MSKTEENVQAAFAGESQANRKYLFLRNKQKKKALNRWLDYSGPLLMRRRFMHVII